ncbi:MAG TPA: hypothetical protein VJR89_19995 [Polyangiales bacterium]|nr:hypothetical protein [Polyangiales bacterium]
MFTKQLLIALAAPIALAASTVHAAAGPSDQCVFEKYAPQSVAPYRMEENYGYGTYTKLRGAQLFVPAREGLTAEWLALSVQRALNQGPAESCQLTVPQVSVSVVSAGSGFWVRLGASDDAAAEKLLRWAQSIAPAQAHK